MLLTWEHWEFIKLLHRLELAVVELRGASSSSSTRRQPRVPSLQPLADLHDAPVRQPDIPSGVADGEDYVAPNVGDVSMDVAPPAAGEAEALVDEGPELDEPFSVLVDGVALGSSFPLATIRAACSSLGLGRSGGKLKCLETEEAFGEPAVGSSALS